MVRYLNSKQVSDIIGVNISTLKRWTENGTLDCDKTAGGHRKFTMNHIRDYYRRNPDANNSADLKIEDISQKQLFGHIQNRDFKKLAEKLAKASLDSDEVIVSNIINGLYMNGVLIADILDYVVDVAGHIVEAQLSNKIIVHTEAYVSRQLLTRVVDGLCTEMPNGTFNGKSAMCINFEDNLPDIGVVMSEVVLRHSGYNVFNTGSHAELGDLSIVIQKKKIDIILFYLCNLQCCNAVVLDNIEKTKEDIHKIIKIAKKINVKVFFGGEGFLLLKDIHDSVDNSFLTYNNLQKIV
ncbi:MAG: MerR family transcriptional regulator [Fidelibacterota bacterium]